MINNADGKVIIDTRLDTSGAKKDASSLGSVISKGAKLGTAAIAGVGTAAAVAGGYALQVGMSFEQGMSKVSAISGATGKDLDMLTDKAKEMGAKTKFSATEATEAFQYMAMAGWKTGEMLDGIEGIMNLAAASGEDLATTSDIVTDALTAFGLSAKDSSHFADVLAAASSNANTNVSMLGESFKYVAPVAGALGYSVEDISVALSLMANSGIKASQGGTALRRLLTNLTKPSKAAASAMKELGINIKNADGTVKPFNELMSQLRTSFSKLTDAEKAEYAASLAGQTGMSGLLAIVNSSDKDFEKLTKAINNADGASEKMAETMQNNLQGQITILKSSVEGLGIALYDTISKDSTSMVKVGQEYVNQMKKGLEQDGVKGLTKAIGDVVGKIASKVPGLLKKLIPIVINFTKSLIKSLIAQVPAEIRPILDLIYNLIKSALPALKNAFNGLLAVLKIIVSVMSDVAKYFNENKNAMALLKGIIVAVTAAYVTYKAVMIATNTATAIAAGASKLLVFWTGLQEGATYSAAIAQAGLNATMLANPVGLVVAAVAALVAILVVYNATAERSGDNISRRISLLEQENERLDKEAEAIRKANEEMEKQNETNTENAQNTQSHMEYIEGLADELFDLADATGKVKDADKDRAQFILDQLNDALGTEYELTGNQIENYKKLKKSIYDTIEAKTNELMLSQYQQSYTEALKKRNAEEAKLKKAAKEYNQAQIDSNFATSRMKEMTDKASMSLSKYIKTYTDGTESSEEVRAGYERMVNSATMYIHEHAKLADEEKKHADKTKKVYENQSKKVKTIYSQMIQYESAYVQATKGNSKEAQTILTADTKKFDAIGTHLTEGVADGMSSAKAQKAIRKASSKVANMTLKQLRKELDIHSPSRKAKKLVGYEVARGVVAGFEDEKPFKQIEADIKKGTASLNTQSQIALNNSINAGFNYDKLVKAFGDSGISFKVGNKDFARLVQGVI